MKDKEEEEMREERQRQESPTWKVSAWLLSAVCKVVRYRLVWSDQSFKHQIIIWTNAKNFTFYHFLTDAKHLCVSGSIFKKKSFCQLLLFIVVPKGLQLCSQNNVIRFTVFLQGHRLIFYLSLSNSRRVYAATFRSGLPWTFFEEILKAPWKRSGQSWPKCQSIKLVCWCRGRERINFIRTFFLYLETLPLWGGNDKYDRI